ncbi:SIS domain-containing protein [uncultured Shimia sp.]|uniref:SIS domain-containing protein n=1 Tax=uncultured Shimia sp. TaxID=573152 RepID=UPI0025D75974|nr:SIS domain-containing protein [uncultured Shimia sp.]
MTKHATVMASEIHEIPSVLESQIANGLEQYIAAGRAAAAGSPRGFVTCARGTSDHAATFFKYVMELKTGLPVASIGPSVASVYDTPLKLDGFACLTFSQSGGSPDLAALQAAAKSGGASTYAFLNVAESPVGQGADLVLPLLAGPELAVAATKSYVATLFAILGFAAGFCEDKVLEKALRSFPDQARLALSQDWTQAQFSLARAASLFTVGRGPGMAVAAEAALKLKETCRIHAEVYSAAEVLHGPVVIAQRQFAALLFDPEDQARQSVLEVKSALANKQADAFLVTSQANDPLCLSVPASQHPLLHPLLQIIGFYVFVEELSRNLGENADAPEGLNKVTVTL